MKKIVCLVAIAMFLLIGSQAWAQGDVGSVECLTVQQATQTAVDEGGPYKNPGALVKTAAQAANPYLYDGTITEECHSCIVSQFARQVPIGDQELCGECPTYDLCSTTDYPLIAACDPCVASVCAYDSYCCTVNWDSICVAEAVDTCGIDCGVACAHDLCVTGDPLDPACDPCVETVCANDEYCCGSTWDGICVGEAVTLCSISCPEATCWADACGGQSPAGCYCDEACCGFGDCCPDAESVCSIVCDGDGS